MKRRHWTVVLTSLLALPFVVATASATENPSIINTTVPGGPWIFGPDVGYARVNATFTAQQSSTNPQSIVNVTGFTNHGGQPMAFGVSAQLRCGTTWVTKTVYTGAKITVKAGCTGLGSGNAWAGIVNITSF